MMKNTAGWILGWVACVVVSAGCGERAVVGETPEGILRGGDTLKVTGDAPPREAVTAHKTAEGTHEPRRGSLLESDPWLRAQLAQSGSVIPGPMAGDVFLRPASAPAPVTVTEVAPAPAPEAAPPADAPIAP